MSTQLNFDNLPITGQSRQALERFAANAVAHPEVEGVILYGSSLWKNEPADLDFVIMLAKEDYVHFYGVHTEQGVRCEVEYVTAPALEDYLKYPHWRVGDWELDVGAKYVHGLVLLDRNKRLAKFKERLHDEEGFKVRRYLFVHQLGQATSRLNKLATRLPTFDEPEVFQLTADFAHAFDAAAHNSRLTFPRKAHDFEGWPLSTAQRKVLIAPGQVEKKAEMLAEMEIFGIANLELPKLFKDSLTIEEVLEKLPIYHLVDYTGLASVLDKIRPDIKMPSNLLMPLFNA